MSGALGGLDKILGYFDPTGGGFNVENIIRQSTNSIAGAVGLRGCNQPPHLDPLIIVDIELDMVLCPLVMQILNLY